MIYTLQVFHIYISHFISSFLVSDYPAVSYEAKQNNFYKYDVVGLYP